MWSANESKFSCNSKAEDTAGRHQSQRHPAPRPAQRALQTPRMPESTRQPLDWLSFLLCPPRAVSSPRPWLLGAWEERAGSSAGVRPPQNTQDLILPLSLLGYQQDVASSLFLPWFPHLKMAALCLDRTVMDGGHNQFKTLSELDENVLQPLKMSFLEVMFVHSCSYPECNLASNTFKMLSLNLILKYSLFFMKPWHCLGCLLTLVNGNS